MNFRRSKRMSEGDKLFRQIDPSARVTTVSNAAGHPALTLARFANRG